MYEAGKEVHKHEADSGHSPQRLSGDGGQHCRIVLGRCSRRSDIVEVDVRFTRDGVPVLSHDAVSPDAEASLVRVSEILRLMKEYPQIKVNFDIKETQGLRQLGR